MDEDIKCSFCSCGQQDGRIGIVRGSEDAKGMNICDVCLCMSLEALSQSLGVPPSLTYETLKWRHALARIDAAAKRSVAKPGEVVSVGTGTNEPS